ncbi:MAG: homoserine dehydrogenase [Lachnospiraceae bacterium]|nr:homoserine dehydrogenase [Lachnospiraceae bacterium]
MIQVAVLGYGTVGSGVVEVIEKNKEEINKRAAEELNIKYILDLRDFPGDPYEDKVIHDFNTIIEDPDIKIICETMGGLKPAYEFTKQALLKGISVCTSNKELVAAHGPELIRIAKENTCNYLFEASVGGGIPIIRPLNYSLTAEKIDSIMGILNGTTNYILTKMERENASFEDVLKEAQDKGYAERNPEADIEGHDACRKIAILSSLMAEKTMRYENVYTEGISKITLDDFKYAAKMERTIKLLGISREENGKYFAMVAPFLIPKTHPMAMVNGVFNAIFVHGNMLDDSMYYGRGAGKLPTASAVVSDVVDAARHVGKIIKCFWDEEEVAMKDIKTAEFKYFVRCDGSLHEEALGFFEQVSIVDANVSGEIGFVTAPMSEEEFEKKAAKLGIISRIRLMD